MTEKCSLCLGTRLVKRGNGVVMACPVCKISNAPDKTPVANAPLGVDISATAAKARKQVNKRSKVPTMPKIKE